MNMSLMKSYARLHPFGRWLSEGLTVKSRLSQQQSFQTVDSQGGEVLPDLPT